MLRRRVVIDQRDKLFRIIQMYGFALDEINLYLDTHPKCQDGLDYYHRYSALKKEAVEEYKPQKDEQGHG